MLSAQPYPTRPLWGRGSVERTRRAPNKLLFVLAS
jgi:hypothetical protein